MKPFILPSASKRQDTKNLVRLLLAGLFLSLPVGTLANVTVQSRIEAEFGAFDALRNAVDALAYAVSIGDKPSVAALVRYPLTVDLAGEQKVIEDEQAFIASYDDIVTPRLGGTLITENVEDAVIVEEGVAIAGGQVRLMPFCIPGSCASRYWLISAISSAP